MQTNRTAANRSWLLAICFSGSNRRCRGVLFFAILSLLPLPGLSDSPVILLLQSGAAPIYQKVSSTIVSDLESICGECRTYQIKQLSLGDAEVDPLLKSDSSRLKLIVSIGVKAAQRVATSKTSAAKLYTLIPKSFADSLMPDATTKRASAIYLDQPFTRQLNLVNLIRSDQHVLGILFGPATATSRTLLESTAETLGIPILTETATKEDEVGLALNRLLNGSDFILALPDPLIYNRNTIFNILLSSYHNRIPFIGFSASYVKAGAMLAVYSTPSDIGMHIAETIRQFVINGGADLPESAFPRYFSIETNRSVAHSLDINLPASTELKQLLDRLERP
jgi:putative tryptophan/tyrosine transport system substrate-binding protein